MQWFPSKAVPDFAYPASGEGSGSGQEYSVLFFQADPPDHYNICKMWSGVRLPRHTEPLLKQRIC